jgi:hypothetical protein
MAVDVLLYEDGSVVIQAILPGAGLSGAARPTQRCEARR